MMESTRVLIVDDHALFRHGVRTVVERDGDMQVVGEAGSGKEALLKARELEPDLVLMDIKVSHSGGMEMVRAIKNVLPDTKVVVLTVHDEGEHLVQAVKEGAEGFLPKNVQAEALLDSLRRVMGGEPAIPRHMVGIVLQELVRLSEIEAANVCAQLSPRESEVLGGLCQGRTNVQIGKCLGISQNTVKAHVTNILRKLNLPNRLQAAAYARQLGLDAAGWS